MTRLADRAAVLSHVLAALVLAVLARPALAAPALQPVPLDRLRDRLDPSVRSTLTPEGLAFEVSGPTRVQLPFVAEELELVVEADAPILLIWAVQVGAEPTPWGRPWRYQTLPRRSTAIRFDLKTVAGWTPSAHPALGFDGEGRVLVRSIRALAPRGDVSQAREAYDRARFWAPESVGPVLINSVTPMSWCETCGTWLADVVALVALVTFGAVLAGLRLRRARWRPGTALAAAALVALALWNGYTLVRFAPMANVRPTPDAEERIRTNYYYLQEFGALAALARATIGPQERVGAISSPRGWFAPQTLCFDLAPRRCVIVRQGEQVHTGIADVGKLRTSDLDVIVSYRASELPPGFVPVATVGPRAFVARRR